MNSVTNRKQPKAGVPALVVAKPDRQADKSKKRKGFPGTNGEAVITKKKPKSVVSKTLQTDAPGKGKVTCPAKTNPAHDDDSAPLSKRERRLRAKELIEARKKKRKRHYNLEQELALLWEKMRRRNIGKEERSKFITDALQKMKGKIPEITSSHVSSRVLQTCIKYCSEDERNSVFAELRPHFLTLGCNKYAVHLVNKMLDNASKTQLAGFISSLHGHVASLLRHVVGSVVIEHTYKLGSGTQKREILMELYSAELQLFKDLSNIKENRLEDIIHKLGLQKSSVLRHMTSVLHPVLEKGIVDHSIIHKVLIEYLSIADKSSAADVIQQLSGPLLVRMINTRDGSRIGMLCIRHGSAKERKKIVKGMKGLVEKIARDPCGTMVLVCSLSTIDDTKLLTKVVVRELESNLKELLLEKNARRPILQLLHPFCHRYFSPEDLASLNSSVPSLHSKEGEELQLAAGGKQEKVAVGRKVDVDEDKLDGEAAASDIHLVEGGKKDPSIRRQELLINSGLAEKLIDACFESAEELLTSNFGKEVLYEVATGGADGILLSPFALKLTSLYETIASLVARPRSEDDSEHLLENFHSSRTIRKLVLDCPAFATILWNTALKGKCGEWASGHSSKVVLAFMGSGDASIRDLAKAELQPLVESGILALPPVPKSVGREGQNDIVQ